MTTKRAFTGFLDQDSKKGKEHEQGMLRKRQCMVCPLGAKKQPDPDIKSVDVLLISPPREEEDGSPTRKIGPGTLRAERSLHVFDVECPTNTLSSTIVECCLGRKLDMIKNLKPKVVVSVGTKIFNAIESGIGLDPDGFGVGDGEAFPSEYEGHRFWHMVVPPFGTKQWLLKHGDKLEQLQKRVPHVGSVNFDGVTLVMDKYTYEEALAALVKMPAIAIDFETSGERPYNSKILTVAFSNGEQTFVFPVNHPGRPKSANRDWWKEVYYRIHNKKRIIIYHNAIFDAEWASVKLGDRFPFYECQLEDTQAQSYILYKGPKSLQFVNRRHQGTNLKKYSNLNRKELISAPIEKVMQYNGLDAKYTFLAWLIQDKEINRCKMRGIYMQQMDAIKGCGGIQIRGLTPNPEFIAAEYEKREKSVQELDKKLIQFPEIIKFQSMHGEFNPGSGNHISVLMHDFYHVEGDFKVKKGGKISESFDEVALTRINLPIVPILLDQRGETRLLGTNLLPFHKNIQIKGAGKHIHNDGLIHPRFNPFGATTGRLSSADPNAQNQPSGLMKYMRNIVRAAIGEKFFSADYGQIEYRIIAALSEDPVMIDAILNDRDIHAFWATRFIETFPKIFRGPENDICTKDPEHAIQCDPICYKCWFKNFRGRCKNSVVFPLCFGAGVTGIARAMGITPEQQTVLSDMFWDEHKVVKQWQRKLQRFLEKHGYVENMFGRRYYGPLKCVLTAVSAVLIWLYVA